MATLERTRDSTSTTTAVDSSSTASTYAPSPSPAPAGAVPAPFPVPAPDQPRGRPALSHQSRSEVDAASASRSPNGTRRSLSKIGDRIKRAVSQARDRDHSTESGLDRGRSASGSAATTTDEPRGRSPFSGAFSPRAASASRGRQSLASSTTTTTAPPSQYPLSATQTRSSSRGRTILSATSALAGGKVTSSGRGGAGNLVAIANDAQVDDFRGEEDPDLVRQIREDRSKSREREGRIEVATSGRGGRGNIRSQSASRDLEAGRVPTVLEEQERVDKEDELLREEECRRREEREKATPPSQRWVSSGRGGAGNFHPWGKKTTS
ncbi:hypothetical protein JCM11491_001520 [Sporobolomyces phaffii]